MEKVEMPKGPIMHLPKGDHRLKVPQGLEPILDEITQEILRYMPDDMLQFLAKYFSKKLENRNAKRKSWEWRKCWDGPSALNDEDLQEFLTKFSISSEVAHKHATKIEAAFRGHLVRKNLKKRGKVLHKDHRKSWEWKKWSWEGTSILTEEQLVEFLEGHNVDLQSANKYATKIQAIYRGHAVRRAPGYYKSKQDSLNKRLSKGSEYRLPSTANPIHYDILIKPNMENFTFVGTEFIRIKIMKSTAAITLNAAELNVVNAIWRDSSGTEHPSYWIEVDDAFQILRLHFKPKLLIGCGILYLHFNGVINDKMKGFYRSSFKDVDEKVQYNLVTQFQPTDARRAFPCWDEPGKKATFDISLIVDKEKVALSNMPVAEIRAYPDDEKLHVVKYHISPVMSSYLVAYVVGDFDYVETTSSDDVLCRVYTPLGKKNQGKFALSVAADLLPFYNEYFGIPYTLPKLDLVAVNDFYAGAMENWGLIISQESCLLLDEAETSTRNRQHIALTIAHEISHQWFGNLVTMEWYNDLWLNEGFATFMETFAVDYLFPDYDIWTQFVTETFIRALKEDALQNSHPMQVSVENPMEIEELFDDITYSKAACIIRMLYHYIGDSDFRTGMNLYLQHHQYKNTVTDDLWQALEEESGKPIGEIMYTWTMQMGFPLIRVYQPENTEEGRIISLSQEKFWANPANKNPEKDLEYQWMIPLSFCSSSNPTTSFGETLMEDETISVILKGIENDHWVKLNPGSIGFYRVCYPSDMLVQFYSAICDKELAPLDRLALIDDLFAMVQCGESSTIDLLTLLEAYRSEDDYNVWCTIANIMKKLNILFASTDYYEDFKSFGRFLFHTIEQSLGWDAVEEESHLQTLLRPLVFSSMASFEHEGIIKESIAKYIKHLQAESVEQLIPADLRYVVYKVVISVGDEETLENMKTLYKNSTMSEEKHRIGCALGASKRPELLKKALEFAISEDVRYQDAPSIISVVSKMTPEGRELTWNFFKENKILFQERYPTTGGGLISRLVKDIIEEFSTEEIADEIIQFFKENSFPGTERAVQQGVESIRLNHAWMERDQIPVGEFLTKVGLKSFNLSHLIAFNQ